MSTKAWRRELVSAMRARRRAAGQCIVCEALSPIASRCDECKGKQEMALIRREQRAKARQPKLLPLPPVVDGVPRPRTRAECPEGPCPWVGCRHHLAILRITPLGKIVFAFPEIAPEDVDLLEETCSLRVAEYGAITMDAVGRLTNTSKERIEQVTFDTLEKAAHLMRNVGIDVTPTLAAAREQRRTKIIQNHKQQSAIAHAQRSAARKAARKEAA